MYRPPPSSTLPITLFPHMTLFRSEGGDACEGRCIYFHWSGAVFGANRAGGSCRGAPWRDAYCADRRCAVAVGVEGCPRFVVSVGIQRGGGFAQGAGLVLPYDGGAFGACRAPCCAFRCQGRPGSA